MPLIYRTIPDGERMIIYRQRVPGQFLYVPEVGYYKGRQTVVYMGGAYPSYECFSKGSIFEENGLYLQAVQIEETDDRRWKITCKRPHLTPFYRQDGTPNPKY